MRLLLLHRHPQNEPAASGNLIHFLFPPLPPSLFPQEREKAFFFPSVCSQLRPREGREKPISGTTYTHFPNEKIRPRSVPHIFSLTLQCRTAAVGVIRWKGGGDGRIVGLAEALSCGRGEKGCQIIPGHWRNCAKKMRHDGGQNFASKR